MPAHEIDAAADADAQRHAMTPHRLLRDDVLLLRDVPRDSTFFTAFFF